MQSAAELPNPVLPSPSVLLGSTPCHAPPGGRGNITFSEDGFLVVVTGKSLAVLSLQAGPTFARTTILQLPELPAAPHESPLASFRVRPDLQPGYEPPAMGEEEEEEAAAAEAAAGEDTRSPDGLAARPGPPGPTPIPFPLGSLRFRALVGAIPNNSRLRAPSLAQLQKLRGYAHFGPLPPNAIFGQAVDLRPGLADAEIGGISGANVGSGACAGSSDIGITAGPAAERTAILGAGSGSPEDTFLQAAWSGRGMAPSGGCILAAVSQMGRVAVYAPTGHPQVDAWDKTADLSEAVLEWSLALRFRGDDAQPALVSDCDGLPRGRWLGHSPAHQSALGGDVYFHWRPPYMDPAELARTLASQASILEVFGFQPAGQPGAPVRSKKRPASCLDDADDCPEPLEKAINVPSASASMQGLFASMDYRSGFDFDFSRRLFSIDCFTTSVLAWSPAIRLADATRSLLLLGNRCGMVSLWDVPASKGKISHVGHLSLPGSGSVTFISCQPIWREEPGTSRDFLLAAGCSDGSVAVWRVGIAPTAEGATGPMRLASRSVRFASIPGGRASPLGAFGRAFTGSCWSTPLPVGSGDSVRLRLGLVSASAVRVIELVEPAEPAEQPSMPAALRPVAGLQREELRLAAGVESGTFRALRRPLSGTVFLQWCPMQAFFCAVTSDLDCLVVRVDVPSPGPGTGRTAESLRLNAVPSHFRQILLAAVRKLSPYRGAQDLPQEDSRPEGVDLAAGSSTASATGGPGHDAQCNPVGLAPHALPHLLGLAPWLSGNTAAMLLAPLDDVAFQLASPVVHVVAMPSLFAVAPEALVGLGPEALLAGTFCPEPDTPSAASRHLAADVARLYARDVRPFFPAVAQATANYHRWLLQRVLGDCNGAARVSFALGEMLLHLQDEAQLLAESVTAPANLDTPPMGDAPGDITTGQGGSPSAVTAPSSDPAAGAGPPLRSSADFLALLPGYVDQGEGNGPLAHGPGAPVDLLQADVRRLHSLARSPDPLVQLHQLLAGLVCAFDLAIRRFAGRPAAGRRLAATWLEVAGFLGEVWPLGGQLRLPFMDVALAGADAGWRWPVSRSEVRRVVRSRGFPLRTGLFHGAEEGALLGAVLARAAEVLPNRAPADLANLLRLDAFSCLREGVPGGGPSAGAPVRQYTCLPCLLEAQFSRAGAAASNAAADLPDFVAGHPPESLQCEKGHAVGLCSLSLLPLWFPGAGLARCVHCAARFLCPTDAFFGQLAANGCPMCGETLLRQDGP
ncbi:hypothetical protein H696_03520 [Fonticula alba]|uniref:Uncharacterized protein n=1 Tax=Fonticula alba TaxID=691883 RepID=A0A058Z971_FONAL|nr:hypothetical protein H696_03520 [Fonticula alba]KCV70057.1 hypothetical protein H696_03520 [Fonticula alba]|eukprot:XP_009495663.1 hypothetical protein H696_03520 [Fonticula alba]